MPQVQLCGWIDDDVKVLKFNVMLLLTLILCMYMWVTMCSYFTGFSLLVNYQPCTYYSSKLFHHYSTWHHQGLAKQYLPLCVLNNYPVCMHKG